MGLTLVIGNKNYSSWSLRPWLVLKQAGVPFEEIFVPLYEPGSKEKILQYSPSGKVPLLIHGKVKVWESLAIAEYLAELFPKAKLWPADIADRAWARAISQEMHAGFTALRTHMPMNVRSSYPGHGRHPEVDKDIARVSAIWRECRERFKNRGEFLFGHFTIADAMYAPVVFRFKTYGVPLSGLEKDYFETMLNLPAMKEWAQVGLKETQRIAQSEIYANK